MNNFDQLSEYINGQIAQIPYPQQPAGLYRPIAYALESGGKRLRPTLLLAVMVALGADVAKGTQAAMGIEMFHNFTLLHDDVMDNADVRRGHPTVHRKYGRDAAILSGDTMLTMATQMMMQCPDEVLRPILEVFNTTAIEVYEGQQMDMDFENSNDVTVDQYMEMIRLKTSVLLGCACKCGAILAGAGAEVCDAFYKYGELLGLAFQLRDDYLDTYGDPVVFGKQIGGDIVNEKKTWLLITALGENRGETLRAMQIGNVDDQTKIEAVRAVYDALDLDRRIGVLIDDYANKAVEVLAGLDIDSEWKQMLSKLALDLCRRMN